MAINLSKGGSATERPEDGTYLARLIGIVNLDHQPEFAYGEGATAGTISAGHKVALTYELVSKQNSKGANFTQTEEVNKVLGDRANLTKRMKALDPLNKVTNSWQEIDGVLGASCMLTIGSTGKGSSKVGGVASPVEGIPIANATNDLYLFDFDNPVITEYIKIPEFIQKKLHRATDFEGSALQLAMIEAGVDKPEESKY